LQPPKNVCPILFYSCLAAHHVDYFGKVILTSPRLFALMRKIVRQEQDRILFVSGFMRGYPVFDGVVGGESPHPAARNLLTRM